MPQRGFPHSDIADSSRAHTPGRRFSQCITSFVGILCPGIPRVLLLAFSVFPCLNTEKLLPVYVFCSMPSVSATDDTVRVVLS